MFNPRKRRPNPSKNWPKNFKNLLLPKKVKAKPIPIAGRARSDILKAIS